MASAPWDDLLQFDKQLDETERQVRDSIRSFCDQRLMPGITEANRHEKFDRSIFTDMGDLGMLGATLPEEYGGPGLNHVCYGLIAREVERVDSAYRSALSVQSSLVIHPIHAFGQEALKKRQESRRRLSGQWLQNLDHQLPHCRCLCGLGQARGQNHRFRD